MSDLDIKEIRKNLKLTQQEFAERLGVSRNTILNYEKGETIPNSKSIILHTMLSESKMENVHSFINKIKEDKNIPLIPIDAMAGFGAGDIQVMDYDTEKYVVPEFTELNVDFMIRIKGSSMYPKYSSGDIVACKKLSRDDLFFQWNKVYVIDTEQGALIKRIDQAEDDNYVTIVSDNEKYKPFLLKKSKINAISIVIGVIRLE